VLVLLEPRSLVATPLSTLEGQVEKKPKTLLLYLTPKQIRLGRAYLQKEGVIQERVKQLPEEAKM
jgi:hypothetical protein